MIMQLSHQNSRFNSKTFPITLITDQVSNASNLGALLRMSDAFGIDKLIFCGDHIEINRKALRTARATEKSVDYEIRDNINSVIDQHANKNYQIIALEITSSSEPIHNFNFNTNLPIVLVVGDENFGISDDILAKSDAVIHIEMFGQNSSMNVAQATNIALYEITKQFL